MPIGSVFSKHLANLLRVPPNVKFEIDDVEQPWVNGQFDYIFSRYMSTSIEDWPKLMGNVFEFVPTHPLAVVM